MKKDQIRYLTALSILMALVVLMGLTPIGLLHVGPIYVTLLCIPVIIGTLLLGLGAGLTLGLTFGSVSFYVGMTAPSALVMPVVQNNVLYLVALCYVPRLLLPLVSHQLYRALGSRQEKKAITLAALAGSFTNTVFYLGLLLLFYITIGLDHAAILGTLGSIVLFAGIPEGIAAAIVSVPVMTALKKAGLTIRHSN